MSNDLHVSLFSKVIVRSNSNDPQGNFNNVNCEWEVGYILGSISFPHTLFSLQQVKVAFILQVYQTTHDGSH